MNKMLKLVTAVFAFSAIAGAALAQAGDPKKGERVFKKCIVCHAVGPNAKNKIGPQLNNIVGAKAAAQDKFRYSTALKEASKKGLVWTEDKLKAYLESPRKVVPGGRMAFAGLRNKGDQADVVAYLKTFAKK